MTKTTSSSPPAVGSRRTWTWFLLGFAALYGVLTLAGELDATGRWGLAGLAAVLVAAALVSPRLPVRRLGLGRPGWRALAVAAAVSGIVQLVYPLTEALSGADLRLRPDWPWLLIGLFAYHGLAEELVWRGYAFRRLRDGRSFAAATAWTMPLIAATHLPIVFTLGPAVGAGAMLVAAVTSLPFAYLYETGRCTVWAPALLHAAIDSFKLVVIPAAALPTFAPLILATGVLVPLLALAVPRRLLCPHSPVAPSASSRATSR